MWEGGRIPPPTDDARLRRQALFWTSVLVALGVFLWLLGPVLLPFVLGMAIGYLLDPLVDRLARGRLSRGAVAGILIAGSWALGTLTLVLVTPLVAEQVAALLARLPAYASAAYTAAAPLASRFAALMGFAQPVDPAQSLAEGVQRMAGPLAGLAAGLLGQGLALLNLVALLAITPLVAFYLLRDWPRILAEVDGWLPREHADTVRAQAREIDRVLAGFVRGAAIVCVLLAAFYALALTAVGLDFGLVIGLVAGAVSFVPFLGALVGLVSSVGVAAYQFWPDWGRVLVVLAIFVVGQIGSDYVLTPRLVGDRVGLHPLWVIFAVCAGGALFGFVGMLVAVPACAVIGVLARFAIGRYKASSLYRGAAGTGVDRPL